MKNIWLIGAWKWFVWKVMSPAQILIGRNVRVSACKWVCKGNNPLKNSPGTYSGDQKLFLKLGQSLVTSQFPDWMLEWPGFLVLSDDHKRSWYQDSLWITQKQQGFCTQVVTRNRGQEITIFWECPNQTCRAALPDVASWPEDRPSSCFQTLPFERDGCDVDGEGAGLEEQPYYPQYCCIIQDITGEFCALLLPYLHPALQVESQLQPRSPCDGERSCLGYFEGDLKERRGTVQMAWGFVCVQCC